MIGWNPSWARGQHGHADERVQLGPHSDDERLLRRFVLFAIMVVRDGVPPDAAHRAFLALDE
jgi:hypothetical protein